MQPATAADRSSNGKVTVSLVIRSTQRSWDPRTIQCSPSDSYLDILRDATDISLFTRVFVNGTSQPIHDTLRTSSGYIQESALVTARRLERKGNAAANETTAQAPVSDATPSTEDIPMPMSLRLLYELEQEVKDCATLGCLHLVVPVASRRICLCCSSQGHPLTSARLLRITHMNHAVVNCLNNYPYWLFMESELEMSMSKQLTLQDVLHFSLGPDKRRPYIVVFPTAEVMQAAQRSLSTDELLADHVDTTLSATGDINREYRLHMISHWWRLVVCTRGASDGIPQYQSYPKVSLPRKKRRSAHRRPPNEEKAASTVESSLHRTKRAMLVSPSDADKRGPPKQPLPTETSKVKEKGRPTVPTGTPAVTTARATAFVAPSSTQATRALISTERSANSNAALQQPTNGLKGAPADTYAGFTPVAAKEGPPFYAYPSPAVTAVVPPNGIMAVPAMIPNGASTMYDPRRMQLPSDPRKPSPKSPNSPVPTYTATLPMHPPVMQMGPSPGMAMLAPNRLTTGPPMDIGTIYAQNQFLMQENARLHQELELLRSNFGQAPPAHPAIAVKYEQNAWYHPYHPHRG